MYSWTFYLLKQFSWTFKSILEYLHTYLTNFTMKSPNKINDINLNLWGFWCNTYNFTQIFNLIFFCILCNRKWTNVMFLKCKCRNVSQVKLFLSNHSTSSKRKELNANEISLKLNFCIVQPIILLKQDQVQYR